MSAAKKQPFVPGTQRWWQGESVYGPRGIVDAILVLLENGEISRNKARELISSASIRGSYELPDAPWESVQWGEP